MAERNDVEPLKSMSNIPSLVAALAASTTTGGTIYAFGLYGNDLKKSLSLSATELDTISTTFFFAGLLSWISGLSADRFGTKFSIVSGGTSAATFLLIYWAVATKNLEVEKYFLVPLLSLIGIFIFLSCGMITGSVFKIIITCCGHASKGSAVGVAKGLVGLGSGAYACIFTSLRTEGESNLNFLLLASVLTVVAAVLPALLLLPSQKSLDRDTIIDSTTSLHFQFLFTSLGIMIVLVIYNSLSALFYLNPDNGVIESSPGRNVPKAMFFVAVWLLPIASLLFFPRRNNAEDSALLINVGDFIQDMEESGEELVNDCQGDMSLGNLSMKDLTSLPSATIRQDALSLLRNDELDSLEEDQSLLNSNRLSREQFESSYIEVEEDKNLIDLLRIPSAWLMLWTTTILVGSGTVETNNMSVMVEALRLPGAVTTSSLALFSAAQSISRVLTGAISESALQWNTKRCIMGLAIPRPFFLVVASFVAVLAHFVLSVAEKSIGFVIGCMLSGVAFGMVWPLMVLIIGDIFGISHLGANYMFYDGFSSAIGTFLVNKGLTQRIYEAHILDVNSTSCYGKDCFRLSHLLISLLALTCVGTSCGLMYSSRRIYNRRSTNTNLV